MSNSTFEDSTNQVSSSHTIEDQAQEAGLFIEDSGENGFDDLFDDGELSTDDVFDNGGTSDNLFGDFAFPPVDMNTVLPESSFESGLPALDANYDDIPGMTPAPVDDAVSPRHSSEEPLSPKQTIGAPTSFATGPEPGLNDEWLEQNWANLDPLLLPPGFEPAGTEAGNIQPISTQSPASEEFNNNWKSAAPPAWNNRLPVVPHGPTWLDRLDPVAMGLRPAAQRQFAQPIIGGEYGQPSASVRPNAAPLHLDEIFQGFSASPETANVGLYNQYGTSPAAKPYVQQFQDAHGAIDFSQVGAQVEPFPSFDDDFGTHGGNEYRGAPTMTNSPINLAYGGYQFQAGMQQPLQSMAPMHGQPVAGMSRHNQQRMFPQGRPLPAQAPGRGTKRAGLGDFDDQQSHKRRRQQSPEPDFSTDNEQRQRALELKDYGYSRPTPRLQPWGSRGQFTYSREGELKTDVKRMSLEDMEEFIWGQPAHRKMPLTFWIGRMPFGVKERFHKNEAYRKCRLSCCLEQKGTIEKGTYTVMFDEFQGCDFDLDPFKMPRVHLWCLERHMDFPRMCRELNVVMENRDVFCRSGKQDKAAHAMVMGGADSAGARQLAIGNAFLEDAKRCAKPTIPTALLVDDNVKSQFEAMVPVYGQYPSHELRGLPENYDLLTQFPIEVPQEGPYFGTLGWRMSRGKNEDTSLQRHESKRPKVPGRKQTRRQSQQLQRTQKRRRRQESFEAEQLRRRINGDEVQEIAGPEFYGQNGYKSYDDFDQLQQFVQR